MKKPKPRNTTPSKSTSTSGRKRSKNIRGRVKFDSRVRIGVRGRQITTDAGLLVIRELDDAIGLTAMAEAVLRDTRPGKNKVHSLPALFRQSVYARVAEYEDVNDADKLAHEPAMRLAVGGRAVDGKAASSSQMSRLEGKTLTTEKNLEALSNLNGQICDRLNDCMGNYMRKCATNMFGPGFPMIIYKCTLVMKNSVSNLPTNPHISTPRSAFAKPCPPLAHFRM